MKDISFPDFIVLLICKGIKMDDRTYTYQSKSLSIYDILNFDITEAILASELFETHTLSLFCYAY